LLLIPILPSSYTLIPSIKRAKDRIYISWSAPDIAVFGTLFPVPVEEVDAFEDLAELEDAICEEVKVTLSVTILSSILARVIPVLLPILLPVFPYAVTSRVFG
jgi:hypothetical protein